MGLACRKDFRRPSGPAGPRLPLHPTGIPRAASDHSTGRRPRQYRGGRWYSHPTTASSNHTPLQPQLARYPLFSPTPVLPHGPTLSQQNCSIRVKRSTSALTPSHLLEQSSGEGPQQVGRGARRRRASRLAPRAKISASAPSHLRASPGLRATRAVLRKLTGTRLEYHMHPALMGEVEYVRHGEDAKNRRRRAADSTRC